MVKLFLIALGVLALLLACQTEDSHDHVLNMKIDKDNDSLLTFDTLIIKVYSKDSSVVQEVFHGKLTDPKQVTGLALDPRIGNEFTISIIGYKGGKVGVNKSVTILPDNNFVSKDLPLPIPHDSVINQPFTAEILAPSDTSVTEGDSLGFNISVKNPVVGATLSLKEAVPGIHLDTAGHMPSGAFLHWKPGFDQSKQEPYVLNLVYSLGSQKAEKTIRITVSNVNQPPKFTAIPDQKGKEEETLSFKVEAIDPDKDSLSFKAESLPSGATFVGTTFSWKPASGTAANYSVRFIASDGHDSDVAVALVTVGNVEIPPAPVVVITSPGQDTTVNITPFTVSYTVNGTPLTKKVPLKDGKTKVFIDTTIAGRTGMDTVNITLDTIPPGKPVLSGQSPVSTRTPTWTWTPGGGGNGVFRYRLDAEDMSSSTITSERAYTASKDLEPGTHTLYVQERDVVGNWSLTGKSSIRVDTTKPAAPSVSVDNAVTNNPKPNWTWTGSGEDASGLYRYKLDNVDLRTGATESRTATFTPKTGEELKEGAHTLYVQQQDSAGNWSHSGSSTVRVDFTAPNAPKVKTTQTSPTNAAKPEWTWLSGGNGGAGNYRAKLDDTSMASGTTAVSGLSFTPDTSLKEGLHTLYVQEQDSAGNWSKTGSSSIHVDLTSPGAPTVVSSSWHTTNTKPKWTWSTGGGGIGQYRCKVDDPVLGSGATSVSEASLISPNDLSVGQHTLYVQERDSAGNWSATGSMSLRVHGTVGYAAGNGGTIYKTVSGGASWDTLPRKTGKSLYYAFFTDANNGIAVGLKSGFASNDRATILKTSNAGATSDTITNPFVHDLTCAYFTSPSIGFVVGYGGTMGKTSDGGSTWNLVSGSTSQVLNSVFFSDAQNGHAVGRSGTILRTTDGGATWKPTTTGITKDFNSVYFLNTKLGFIVGNQGTVLQTTDGGDSWTPQTSGATAYDLQSVFFTDPKRGYIAAHDVLLKTSDGGLNWKSVSTPATPYLSSVYFTDENVGFVVGEYGLVMKTVDYGETWSTIGLRTGFDLNSVYFP